MNDYDTIAHLSSNENCWGPPESVMKAMNNAWKYSNRYGYPDGDIVQEIAKHHGVKTENILLTAGSGEVLDVVGTTFLPAGKKVLGVDALLRLGLPARDQHQVGSDHAAARQGLPPEHSGADQGGQRQRGAARVRLSLQPEQPDRADRHQQGSEAAARRHSGRHAGADRRGLPSLRGQPGIRDLGAVRARRPSGDHRADVLEDRGAGRHASRLRHRVEGADRQDAAVQHGQHQRAREARRRRGAQGHRRRRRSVKKMVLDSRRKKTTAS